MTVESRKPTREAPETINQPVSPDPTVWQMLTLAPIKASMVGAVEATMAPVKLKHVAPMTKYRRPNLSDVLPKNKTLMAQHVFQTIANRLALPPASPVEAC